MIMALLVGLVAPAIASAQELSIEDRVALAGPWEGEWTGGGFAYEARMALSVTSDGEVQGSIAWTLRAAPREPESGKVGSSGTEFVRGKFLPDAQLLVLEGHEKEDPDNIIGLDQYRLLVSEARRTMGGLTRHHGPWDGRFFLTR
jgi:hypothetical protein